MQPPGEIWTIGHSSRTLEDFLALLHAHHIQYVADVRRFPGSRKFPHFNSEPLERSLKEQGIAYEPFELLGGRRNNAKLAANPAWRNASFGHYATYMNTADFTRGLEALAAAAQTRRTAFMCSEAVWWRCHRALIADKLKSCGWKVWHILNSGPAKEHPYTGPACVADGKLTYVQK